MRQGREPQQSGGAGKYPSANCTLVLAAALAAISSADGFYRNICNCHAAVRISWSALETRSGAPNASAVSRKAVLPADHGSRATRLPDRPHPPATQRVLRRPRRDGRPRCESPCGAAPMGDPALDAPWQASRPERRSDPEGCSRGRASAARPASAHRQQRGDAFGQPRSLRQSELSRGFDHGAYLAPWAPEEDCDGKVAQNLHGGRSCVAASARNPT